MADEDRLKKYMDLLEQQAGRLPSEESLKKLQSRCGLEPEDLKKLSMLVERHGERADIFLHRDNVNGAIEEMERACQLTPRDSDLHLNLAKLYKNRYENYGFLRRDRVRSREEAEATQTLDPKNKEPALLIEEITRIQKSLYGGPAKRNPLMPVLLVLVFVLILVLFSERKAIQRWLLGIFNPPAEVIYIPPPTPFDPTAPREIGLESYDFTGNNLEFTLQQSRVIPVNDHWGYELKGGLTSPSMALEKAVLELRFLGDARDLIYTGELALNEGPLLLPGETLPVDFFFFLPFSPEELDSISLTPGEISLIEAPSFDGKRQKIWWEKEQPDGVKLNIEERESYDLEGYDRNRHFFTFDITQKGSEPIGELELLFRWKDSGENTREQYRARVVESDGPLMKQGESRAIEFQVGSPFALDWDSLSYDITVTVVSLSSH
jgi:hypothetical protein